ncbi:hypothetical protein BJ742DRAFT_777943 [Cladochytrium replicatum]|nr:hypothetical protein BJ742DRAFT_777943 [Cladochytrium replicatum]
MALDNRHSHYAQVAVAVAFPGYVALCVLYPVVVVCTWILFVRQANAGDHTLTRRSVILTSLSVVGNLLYSIPILIQNAYDSAAYSVILSSNDPSAMSLGDSTGPSTAPHLIKRAGGPVSSTIPTASELPYSLDSPLSLPMPCFILLWGSYIGWTLWLFSFGARALRLRAIYLSNEEKLKATHAHEQTLIDLVKETGNSKARNGLRDVCIPRDPAIEKQLSVQSSLALFERPGEPRPSRPPILAGESQKNLDEHFVSPMQLPSSLNAEKLPGHQVWASVDEMNEASHPLDLGTPQAQSIQKQSNDYIGQGELSTGDQVHLDESDPKRESLITTRSSAFRTNGELSYDVPRESQLSFRMKEPPSVVLPVESWNNRRLRTASEGAVLTAVSHTRLAHLNSRRRNCSLSNPRNSVDPSRESEAREQPSNLLSVRQGSGFLKRAARLSVSVSRPSMTGSMNTPNDPEAARSDLIKMLLSPQDVELAQAQWALQAAGDRRNEGEPRVRDPGLGVDHAMAVLGYSSGRFRAISDTPSALDIAGGPTLLVIDWKQEDARSWLGYLGIVSIFVFAYLLVIQLVSLRFQNFGTCVVQSWEMGALMVLLVTWFLLIAPIIMVLLFRLGDDAHGIRKDLFATSVVGAVSIAIVWMFLLPTKSDVDEFVVGHIWSVGNWPLIIMLSSHTTSVVVPLIASSEETIRHFWFHYIVRRFIKAENQSDFGHARSRSRSQSTGRALQKSETPGYGLGPERLQQVTPAHVEELGGWTLFAMVMDDAGAFDAFKRFAVRDFCAEKPMFYQEYRKLMTKVREAMKMAQTNPSGRLTISSPPPAMIHGTESSANNRNGRASAAIDTMSQMSGANWRVSFFSNSFMTDRGSTANPPAKGKMIRQQSSSRSDGSTGSNAMDPQMYPVFDYSDKQWKAPFAKQWRKVVRLATRHNQQSAIGSTSKNRDRTRDIERALDDAVSDEYTSGKIHGDPTMNSDQPDQEVQAFADVIIPISAVQPTLTSLAPSLPHNQSIPTSPCDPAQPRVYSQSPSTDRIIPYIMNQSTQFSAAYGSMLIPPTLKEDYRRFFRTFISQDSPLQVTLSPRIFDEISREFRGPGVAGAKKLPLVSVFDEAKNEVLGGLYKTTFLKFVSEEEYGLLEPILDRLGSDSKQKRKKNRG